MFIAKFRRKYPPQGKLFEIGGFRLHLNCVGRGTPTVVMDAGSGASSITWGLVPSEIAKFTRVCIYDRAGLGWSDPNLRIPRTSQGSKEPEMSDERFQKWASLQLDLTQLSSNSQQIIAENSGHLMA